MKIRKLKESFTEEYIIIFPYAGSLWETYVALKDCLPYNIGLVVAEYPPEDCDFNSLCKSYIVELSSYNLQNSIFLGISFGGYLAYRIAQILYALKLGLPKRLFLVSVIDLPSLIENLKDINLNSLLINNNNLSKDINKEIRNLIAKDLQTLQSIKISDNIILPIDLSIINGSEDKGVNEDKILLYWQDRIRGKLYYSTYFGPHLPNNSVLQDLINRLLT